MSNRLVMICDVDLAMPDARRTHVTAVAEGFARAGFAVSLVSRGDDPALPGVSFHRAGRDRPSRLGRLAAINTAGFRALIGARRRGARHAYVREDWGSLPTILLARLLGYRLVLEINDLPFGPASSGVSFRAGRLAETVKRSAAWLAVRCATGVVTVTDRVRELIVGGLSYPPERVRVIPNGVDVDVFVPGDGAAARTAMGLDPLLRYVLFVGYFAEWVDFATMIDAAARVIELRPDVRLLIVGDGEMAADVDRLIGLHGIAADVVRTGYLAGRQAVATAIQAAAVTLVPLTAAHARIGGGSPVKLAEYLATARPVIATAFPGSGGLLQESGGGITVPPEDPAAMAEAIGRVLDDPDAARAMGEAGRRAVESGYSWQSVVERTIPLFGQGAPA